jgi:exopolysaccharide biosynthesis polyprenyl glycosylphosphotransferase
VSDPVLALRAPAELAPPGVIALTHTRRDSATRRALGLADLLALVTGVVAAVVISGRFLPLQLAWALPAIVLLIVLFKAYGLYDRDIKRVSHTTVDDIPWLFHALLVGALLLWVHYRLVPAPDWRFSEVLVFGGVAFVAVLALRSITRRVVVRLLEPERVLLLGGGDAADALGRKIEAHPEYGLELVERLELPPSPAQICRTLRLRGIDRLVIAQGELDEAELLEVLRRCKELAIKVSVLPQLFDAMGPTVEVDDVEGVTVLGINPPVLSRSSRMLKRGMDIAGASVCLLLAAPLFLAIAIAIKLDTPGPVLFSQRRVGKGGRCFRLYKFRSMVVDAESLHAQLAGLSRDSGWLLLDQDPRITRVGRFLRRASLDELPQLVNVLRGEMSLVGPRPIVEDEDALLTGWRRSRIDLTPGLTGLWQVLGRTRISFDEMVKLDYLYVTNWSLWADIRLLIRTLPVVLSRRGAN